MHFSSENYLHIMADERVAFKPQTLWPKSPQIIYQEWRETQDERKHTKHVGSEAPGGVHHTSES